MATPKKKNETNEAQTNKSISNNEEEFTLPVGSTVFKMTQGKREAASNDFTHFFSPNIFSPKENVTNDAQTTKSINNNETANMSNKTRLPQINSDTQPPPQQPSAPQQQSRRHDSENFVSGSGSSGASLLSKDRQPSGHEEIKAIIKEKLGNISTDSELEIEELVEALVNSGLKKNRETLEAAIEYVKEDIQVYVEKKQKANNEPQNNRQEMEANIIGKIKGYASPAAANKTESRRGSFCCEKGGGMKKKHKRKKTKRTKRQKDKNGRKWSKKYKDSINCKKPKGFSQRQHCLTKSKKRKIAKKN